MMKIKIATLLLFLFATSVFSLNGVDLKNLEFFYQFETIISSDFRFEGDTVNFGKLVIFSNVDEADVYIEGENVGKIKGFKFEKFLSSGDYVVEIRKDKYLPVRLNVKISSGVSEKISANLEKLTAYINVNVEPKDATVYANGKPIGTGSFIAEVERGKVLFRIEKEGYETIEKEEVVDADNLHFTFNLKPIVAKVKIVTEPSEAIVIVNGSRVGVTPSIFNLAYGSYSVQIVKSGYVAENFIIDVKKSELIEKLVKLKETPETKAMRIYKSKLNLKNNLTYAGVGLALLSGGVAVALHIKSEEIYDRYQTAIEIDKIRRYKSEYSKVIRQRNVMIGISSMFVGLAIYNAFREVSYEEIYMEIIDSEAFLGLDFLDYIGSVVTLRLRLRM